MNTKEAKGGRLLLTELREIENSAPGQFGGVRFMTPEQYSH
jgi:hypothetical protein